MQHLVIQRNNDTKAHGIQILKIFLVLINLCKITGGMKVLKYRMILLGGHQGVQNTLHALKFPYFKTGNLARIQNLGKIWTYSGSKTLFVFDYKGAKYRLRNEINL
jgi:hypothetical protein